MRNTEWIAVIAVEVLLGVSGLNRADAGEGVPLPQTAPAEPPRIPTPSELLGKSASLPEVPAVPPIPVPLLPPSPPTSKWKNWMRMPYIPTAAPELPDRTFRRREESTRSTAILFSASAGMKMARQWPDGSFDADIDLQRKDFNFAQGQVYRLRLKCTLPDKSVQTFYPTLEVAPATKSSALFLKHSHVPVCFTDDDFARAKKGQLVVKVIYLPDPSNQDFSTVVGAEEVVSTRLEPGVDPIAEAQRRGTILAIIRMGNINVENGVFPAFRGSGHIVPHAPAPHPVER